MGRSGHEFIFIYGKIVRNFIYCLLFLSLELHAQSGNLSYLVYEKGQGDFRIFNSLYFEKNKQLNSSDEYVFFNVQPEFLLGVGRDLNVGVRFRLRNVIRSSHVNLSDVLRFSQMAKNGLSYRRYGLSGTELFLRHKTSAHTPSLSVQHTIGIPLGKSLEGTDVLGYLDWAGWSYHGQCFYNVLLDKIQLFAEMGLRFDNLTSGLFKKESSYFVYAGIPISFLPGYLIHPQHFTYLLFQTNPRWSVSRSFSSADPKILFDPFTQIGFGYKFFFIHQMEIETIGTLFFSDHADKSAYTISLGLRYYMGRYLY